jgi:hypothetical protein
VGRIGTDRMGRNNSRKSYSRKGFKEIKAVPEDEPGFLISS